MAKQKRLTTLPKRSRRARKPKPRASDMYRVYQTRSKTREPDPDPLAGNARIARLSARYITYLFGCPPHPRRSTHLKMDLPHFIAFVFHHSKLHIDVLYTALVFLERLKIKFPAANGCSGHRLFITAFMLASKVLNDESYTNSAWSHLAGIYPLRDINHMEREMCRYLDWNLAVNSRSLSNFRAMLSRDFCSESVQPYPTYSMDAVSKLQATASSENLPQTTEDSTTQSK
ncbi:hypothetical protein B0H13DRAFT_2377531 [Mycena leptocephala]|nr:hypothetical protein B0H13DRAFT_2377531 [Mycena leptocephala]